MAHTVRTHVRTVFFLHTMAVNPLHCATVSEQTTTTHPVLPEAKMNLVRPNAPVTGRVVSNDMCLKSKANVWVRHTEIDVSGHRWKAISSSASPSA